MTDQQSDPNFPKYNEVPEPIFDPETPYAPVNNMTDSVYAPVEPVYQPQGQTPPPYYPPFSQTYGKMEYDAAIKRGAGILLGLGILTLIGAFILYFWTRSQVDRIPLLSIVLIFIVPVLLLVFSFLLKKGHVWALYAGIALYFIDFLLLIPTKQYGGMVFHAIILGMMIHTAIKLNQAKKNMSAPNQPVF